MAHHAVLSGCVMSHLLVYLENISFCLLKDGIRIINARLRAYVIPGVFGMCLHVFG
jgi:hypothetical protein